MSKIREKLRPSYKDFVAENIPTESTTIPYNKLKDKLYQLLGNQFNEHEMITISRAFPGEFPPEPKYNRKKLRGVVLTELKRYLWDDLDRLREYFIKRDLDRSGKLPKNICYNVLRSCRLPLDVEILERILIVCQKDESCLLLYNDILDFLNRGICSPPDVQSINIKHELSTDLLPYYKPIDKINWCGFNQYLDLEDRFKEISGANTEYHKKAAEIEAQKQQQFDQQMAQQQQQQPIVSATE